MKKLLYLIFFISSFFYGQSSVEIADIYLEKSEEQLKKKELNKALVYFDKAKNLLGDETTAKVEEVGTMIYFELEDYSAAKEHAKLYFELTEDKGSERYNEVLYLYVEIEERIETENRIKAELLAAEMLRQKKQRRLDSLTKVWNDKADFLSVKADTIFAFDKNAIAVYKNTKGFYGIINDSGLELVKPSTYSEFKHYDGKIILLEGAENKVTKIMSYDTATKKSNILPSVSSFNELSTNYGKVMLPRENNLLVTYPNNAKKAFVYDLNTQTFKVASNLEKFYEHWKDKKVIKKFNKENQIKIDKEYLDFGSDLGGYLSFYNEDGSLFGYISSGGTVITSRQYQYFGTLSNGALEAVKSDGSVDWLDETGKKVHTSVNKNGIYGGVTIIIKVNSVFQFINENNEIMKNGETLESLDKFLKNN